MRTKSILAVAMLSLVAISAIAEARVVIGVGRARNNPPGPRGGRGTNWWLGNPPGPAGGPGTNWENPPGPIGGPGAGPDSARRPC